MLVDLVSRNHAVSYAVFLSTYHLSVATSTFLVGFWTFQKNLFPHWHPYITE